jgi:hypothetical protein
LLTIHLTTHAVEYRLEEKRDEPHAVGRKVGPCRERKVGAEKKRKTDAEPVMRTTEI